VIRKQVLRSGTSVGANYREAYRGRSLLRNAVIGLREIDETAYWLGLLSDANLVASEQLQPVRQE
jgi:four helix bundle protein